tara:strand:- start:69 stop:641 length:573 start_codon:yes stop_codon:yes gene_type:complete
VKKIITLFFFLSIFLILSWQPLLRSLAKSLVYESSVSKADAIVVLGGGIGRRVERAVDLYKKEMASKVFFTGGKRFDTSEAHLMAKYAVSLGIPSEDQIIETNSQSTADHPKYLKALFQENKIQSIIIVTSKFHTKRSFLTFQKALGDTYRIGVVAAEDGVDYDAWWRNHEMIQKIVIEWQKYLWYRLFL